MLFNSFLQRKKVSESFWGKVNNYGELNTGNDIGFNDLCHKLAMERSYFGANILSNCWTVPKCWPTYICWYSCTSFPHCTDTNCKRNAWLMKWFLLFLSLYPSGCKNMYRSNIDVRYILVTNHALTKEVLHFVNSCNKLEIIFFFPFVLFYFVQFFFSHFYFSVFFFFHLLWLKNGDNH